MVNFQISTARHGCALVYGRRVIAMHASYTARARAQATVGLGMDPTGHWNSISWQRLQQQRYRSSTAGLRRPRNYQGPIDVTANMPPNSSFGKLEEPYQHGEADLDSYLEKTSLSPWVPLPDVVARKVLDVAQAGPDTVHVDLGSGDGRVCFHALQYGVASSVGIDVDENMVQLAQERLAKRHPAPPNLSFLVADLLDPNNKAAWQHVQEANLITMFFATPALEQLRPLLEQKLAGLTCKIVTSGYEMPGWESSSDEVVLGTQIHLYEWGRMATDEDDDDFLFLGEDILKEKPTELMKTALEGDRFQGANVIDRTGRHPIRGFNPDIFDEDEDDESWDFDAEDSDEDDDSEGHRESETGKAQTCMKSG